MPSASILKNIEINRTPRVTQLEGIFDISPLEKSSESWKVEIPIEDKDWNIGLIVGPSGSGKSTIVKELWKDFIVSEFQWSQDKSIVDDFPTDMSIKEIAMLLSSVGFSSPPLWLRPFHILSNGEKFRVSIARALAEMKDNICVIDEFTSVVDRTVAQIGSAAISKTIKRRNQKFIACSCHYDIAEWLEPDWIYEPHTGNFSRRRLRRPKIEIIIKRVHRSAWRLFSKYHYLASTINQMSQCYVGFLNGIPVVFVAMIFFPNKKRSGWKIHRTVCLPDYQGIGIGNAVNSFVAGLYRAKGLPVFSTTSHPAMIRYRAKSKNWKMLRKPSLVRPRKGSYRNIERSASIKRITAGFEYIGERRTDEAIGFEVIN